MSQRQQVSIQEATQAGINAIEKYYPNPTDGKVTVSTDSEVEAIVIYTLDGRPVGGWKFISLSDSQATLDVSSLADGIYLLTVRTKNGTTVKKLTVAR